MSTQRGVESAARSLSADVARHASPELIKTHAIRLFADKTYPVIGMRELSDAVGILPGSLYAHIPSKESLLLAIVEEGIERYIDAVSLASGPGQPADARLRAAVRAHMQVIETSVEQTRVAFHQWQYLSEPHRERVRNLRRTYLGLFAGIVEDGIAAGTFRAVPHLRATMLTLIGGLSTATEWYVANKADSPEQMADALCDVFLGGLGAQRG